MSGYGPGANFANRPIADLIIERQRLAMKVMARIAAALLTLAMISCAEATPSRRTYFDVAACRASGGYESVAPFGSSFCQMDYQDAGKPCQGKSDCLGRCLSDLPDNFRSISVGTAVAGRCEAHRSKFGCHGKVEGGKLAEPYLCED